MQYFAFFDCFRYNERVYQITGNTMITIFYWIFLAAIVLGVLYFIGHSLKKWPAGFFVAGFFLVVGVLFYYFYLEQAFVKNWGGKMSVKVPQGQVHISATWKDDNLWIENYDPVSNTCIFQEYSRGHMLEGKVVIKDCNPLK